MKKIVLFCFGIVMISIFSCKKFPSEPSGNGLISISVEEVSCTEAWIRVKSENITFPAPLTIKINSQSNEFNISSSDTVIYVNSLLPNKNYEIESSMIGIFNSNKINIVTLDTTSHDFTWQTFTFGQYSSSELLDCALISEDDIWCVGEFYINDSLGNPDPTFYNALHWNGEIWESKKIFFWNGVAPITSIASFNYNDIWFGMGYLKHYNGIAFQEVVIPIWNLKTNKIWGTSSNDFYIVGNDGSIANYQNASWTRIPKITNVPINDIWGDESNFILCAASFVHENGDRKLIKINENNTSEEFLWDTGRRLHSVWFKNRNNIYTSGGGVFRYTNGEWREITEISTYYTGRIRGADINDIFVVGDFGFMAHFNGFSWKQFPIGSADIYYSCAIKNNTVIAVGFKGSKAVITIGKRN